MPRQGSTLRAVAIGWLLAAGLGETARIGIAAPSEDPGPLPDAMLGYRVAPMVLLSRADIAEDVGLDAEQAASAARTLAEIRTKAREIRGLGNAPEVIARRRALDELQGQWLEAQLSEAQRDRLRQVDLQWEGPSALVRPSVIEALGLEPPQVEAIRQAIAERDRVRGRVHAEYARRVQEMGATAAAQRVVEELRAAERPLFEVAQATLRPDQRARWKSLLGRPLVVGGALQDSAVQQAAGSVPGSSRRR